MTISLSLRYKVFERDKYRCTYCGRSPTTAHVTLEVDHYLPRSKGGTDDLTNLRTACFDCNRGKSDVVPSGASRPRQTGASEWVVVRADNEDGEVMIHVDDLQEHDEIISGRDPRKLDYENSDGGS